MLGGFFCTDFSIVGFGFFVAGLAILIPLVLAAMFWNSVPALVEEASGDNEATTLTFSYFCSGKKLLGEVTETTFKREGDIVRLFVCPWKPEDYLTSTFGVWILAIAFTVVGLLFAISMQDQLATQCIETGSNLN